MKILIARDFSDVPIGRHRQDGEFTGEAFREDWLVPKLKNASENDPLVVNLNGAEGYPSSFLEEAFGGLVREHGYSAAQLAKILTIEADNGFKLYAAVIQNYIREADARLQQNGG